MRPDSKITDFFSIAARLILGGIFLYAGIPKILSPDRFAEAVFNYQILPDLLINPVAIVLPWIETAVGILLVTGIWLPGSVLLVNLMLAVFMAAIIYNYTRGLNIDCGCFSSGTGEGIGPLTIARDAVFLAISAFLMVHVFRRRHPEHVED